MGKKFLEALEKNLALRVFRQVKSIGDIAVYFGFWIVPSTGVVIAIAYIVNLPRYAKFLLGLLSGVLVLVGAFVWKLYRSIQITADEDVPPIKAGKMRKITAVASVVFALVLAVAISIKSPKVLTGHQSKPEAQAKGSPPSTEPAPQQLQISPTKQTQTPKGEIQQSAPKKGKEGATATGPNGAAIAGPITVGCGNAQIGGSNNTATTNCGPPTPKITWRIEARESRKDLALNETMIVLSVDHALEIPAFIAICDRPCVLLRTGWTAQWV